MLTAIKKEIFLRRDELQNKNLRSLYFGGGTPSILSSDEIKSIIDEVGRFFSFDEHIEITLEANPDDLTAGFLKDISNSPINRLSIGTQSFFDEDLKLMNRAHNAQQADSSIKRAQDNGFENITIDLIYGSPTSTVEQWKYNLDKVIALEVPHVSAYALTVEPKTVLDHWIKINAIAAPDESAQNEAFFYMSTFLKDQGFNHYEISNFGKPVFHSKHNSAYWQYCEYLGIGPSAHSFDGHRRRSWNIANNSLYIKKINENKTANEAEVLNEKEQYNEMLMIGLRTAKGVDLQRMKNNVSESSWEHLNVLLPSKLAEGILIIEDQYLKIPEEHWFMADGIASDLFQIN